MQQAVLSVLDFMKIPPRGEIRRAGEAQAYCGSRSVDEDAGRSRSPRVGGGWTTRSKCVPASRCMFFFEDSSTVPCEPSDVGVYTFKSGRPNAPLLSGENRPSEVNSPSDVERRHQRRPQSAARLLIKCGHDHGIARCR